MSRSRRSSELSVSPVSASFRFVLYVNLHVNECNISSLNHINVSAAWKCRYEIPVPSTTWIINQPTLSANMYYLSGDLGESGVIRSVRMHAISETQPENHLQTLIDRNLLDEAEKFAIDFNLSLQPIYEAKAKQFVSLIGTAAPDDTDRWKQRISEFFDIAKLITNDEFLLMLRSMDINDRNVMKQLLEFLLARVNFEVIVVRIYTIRAHHTYLSAILILPYSNCAETSIRFG